MDRIVIPPGLMQEMIAHARVSLPNEACGLIGGRGGRAERLYVLRNSDPSPVSYTADARDHMGAMKDMAARGMELMAIYHSHPDSPPMPSITDINRAFFPGTRELNYPGVVHVIISLSGPMPEARAYSIEAGGIRPVEIAPE